MNMAEGTITTSIIEERVQSPPDARGLRHLWRCLRHNRPAMFGLTVIVLAVLAALTAPLISPHSPYAQNLSIRLKPPGYRGYLLGTDEYGRDLLSRIIYGARMSLIVGFGSVAFGAVFGIALGVIAGYFDRLDNLIMRLIDILLAFPGILLALAIIAVLGNRSIVNVIIAIGFWSVPTMARVVRSTVLSIKRLDYITAARSLGESSRAIMFEEILPNCVSPIIVYTTLRLATAILSAASLSYLGLGVQQPTAEWGAMVSGGINYLFEDPYLTLIPGFAIILIVFAFNALGDGLRDALDPNMKSYM